MPVPIGPAPAGLTQPEQNRRSACLDGLGPAVIRLGKVRRVLGTRECNRSDVEELSAVIDAALPGERFTTDELLAGCFDDPGLVLALTDGSGFVSAVVRTVGDHHVGWVRLLAVDPSARRRGHGRALLAAAEQWAFEQGAGEIQLGGSAPFYFWPAVPGDALEMLCLAEAARYSPIGGELNMTIPTTFRASSPPGMTLHRVVDDGDADAVVSFTDAHWPWWVAELRRGIDQGGCHAAFDEQDRAVVGFACHSVNRAAWIGPMGTDAERRGRGVGHALLGALCTDLMTANFRDAEISWVGPVRFYAKAGARVSRMFRSYRKVKP
jgi:GNAT superfamily N-acetyltransferase